MTRMPRLHERLGGAASLTGLALCLFYMLITLACFMTGLVAAAQGDWKGQSVSLQLPIALQLVGVDRLGLLPDLRALPWPLGYALMVLATLTALYGAGWVLGRSALAFQRLGWRWRYRAGA